MKWIGFSKILRWLVPKTDSEPGFDEVVFALKDQAAPIMMNHRSGRSGAPLPESEQLAAMISDCYWCERDDYAAYLWRYSSAKDQKALIGKIDYMAEYGAYLAGIEPMDLGLESDPAYGAATPISIYHLNNEEITMLARRYPALVDRLSKMRHEHLKLSLIDRLEIQESAGKKKATVLPDFAELPSSPRRVLKNRIQLFVANADEERRLIQTKNLPPEIQAEVPTLGWLAKLPDAAIAEILAPFSPRELATAWIGPEEVLAHLERALPDRKREMMRSYRQKMAPSRTSPTFKALHAKSIEYSSLYWGRVGKSAAAGTDSSEPHQKL